MDKFSFAQVSPLSKALKDNADPIPGYLFNEIAKSTLAGYGESLQLCGTLMKKLSKTTSPHLLAKILNVIRHTCDKGSPDFKREVQRKAEQLRECAAFRGKSDPVHGDQLNQAVREAASAALEAAFAAAKEIPKTTRDLSGTGQNSYGSTKEGFKTGQTITGTTGNKLAEHFGHIPSTQQPTYKDTIKNAFSTGFGAWKPTEKDKILAGQQTPSEYIPVSLNVATASGSPITTDPSRTPWKAPGKASSVMFKPDGAGDEGQRSPEYQLVKKLVEECKSSVPSRAMLGDFSSSSLTMDRAELCAALDERLDEKQNWQIRLRALCGIEHLATSGDLEVAGYFKTNAAKILKAENASQESLKQKAVKLAKLLQINRKYVESQAVKAAAASPAAADAMSFDGMMFHAKKEAPKVTDTKALKKRKPRETSEVASADPVSSLVDPSTTAPSLIPTTAPSLIPTSAPSLIPTATPSLIPTATPSLIPTTTPSLIPTATPSLIPTTASPTLIPTPTLETTSAQPAFVPMATPQPMLVPTTAPAPSLVPMATPTPAPVATPTPAPAPAVDPFEDIFGGLDLKPPAASSVQSQPTSGQPSPPQPASTEELFDFLGGPTPTATPAPVPAVPAPAPAPITDPVTAPAPEPTFVPAPAPEPEEAQPACVNSLLEQNLTNLGNMDTTPQQPQPAANNTMQQQQLAMMQQMMATMLMQASQGNATPQQMQQMQQMQAMMQQMMLQNQQ